MDRLSFYYKSRKIQKNKLIEEFTGQFTCLGENTEKKYTTFAVPIAKKVTRIDKNGKEVTKAISYRQKFIDGADFWLAYYQILLIILLDECIKLNLNMDMIMKDVKRVELNTKIATAFLNTQSLKII